MKISQIKQILCPIVATLMCMACQGQKAKVTSPESSPQEEVKEFRSVGASEFAQVIADTNVVLLDVRRADEHMAGHIEGTKLNIDVLKPDFDSLVVASIKPGSTVALYCRSGNRSKRAATILSSKGYRVVELNEGYNGWTEYIQNN